MAAGLRRNLLLADYVLNAGLRLGKSAKAAMRRAHKAPIAIHEAILLSRAFPLYMKQAFAQSANGP